MQRHITQNPFNEDWELLDPPGGERVRLRFRGHFQGKDVLWKATFIALGQAPQRTPNFIEIGPPETDGVPLTVGLALPRFDTVAIRNAVMMIRRYKRLRPGLHQYGAPAGET